MVDTTPRQASSLAFSGPDAPAEGDVYRCVHCGLCLNACPTYLETGLETESPRGRIALMRAVLEGRARLGPPVVRHWDLCLACRACERACPSGVPYGRLIERARAQVFWRRPLSLRALQWLAYRQALPHPWRLRLAARLLFLYQRTGISWLLRRGRLLSLAPSLERAESYLPSLSWRLFPQGGRSYSPNGPPRGRVALLSGCVMPVLQAGTMEAVVRVLTRNGWEVVLPPGQTCCGALNAHAGDLEGARAMARRNLEAFLRDGAEHILTASAGCGSTMKEYAALLEGDPAWRGRAEEFSRRVEDVTEFLARQGLDPAPGPLRVRVTYQDPCHLAHAQGITEAPRSLLRSIPGLELVEMSRPDLCCGAAGSYMLAQGGMAERLLGRKLDDLLATGAQAVATANPGCALQLSAGLRRRRQPLPVYHVVELLDLAYRGGGP